MSPTDRNTCEKPQARRRRSVAETERSAAGRARSRLLAPQERMDRDEIFDETDSEEGEEGEEGDGDGEGGGEGGDESLPIALRRLADYNNEGLGRRPRAGSACSSRPTSACSGGGRGGEAAGEGAAAAAAFELSRAPFRSLLDLPIGAAASAEASPGAAPGKGDASSANEAEVGAGAAGEAADRAAAKTTVKAEEAEKVEGAERLEKAEGEAEGGAVEEQASSAGRKKRQVRAGHDRGTSKTRP